MELVIAHDGAVRCLYGQAIPLGALGLLTICRASHVEPLADGCWQVDLAPVNGPRLGPFDCRSGALAAESDWLATYWLPLQR